MINIAELLKNAPKDLKLYSPICGHCKLSCILHDDGIRVIAHDVPFRFDKYGRFFSADDAECLLFPGEDCRTWEGWELPIEPKFKVNTWIISNITKDIYQVKAVPEYFKLQAQGQYRLQSYTDDSISYFWKNDVENTFHLWKITDAHDGDVLVTDSGWTCIFQAFDGYVFSSYCFMDSQNWFCESGSEVHTLDSRINGNIHPANKEQCNQFFTKMKEVGYIWDAEKKELRKIIKPKFKVGDRIKWIDHDVQEQTIIDIKKDSYITVDKYGIRCALKFAKQDEWELVPKPHYDITNFHAGMPVLVRDSDKHKWLYTIFGIYNKDNSLYPFVVVNMRGYEQCIPFNDDTKHLLGTTEPCGEEFINW